MSEQYTFKDLIEMFQPMAARLAREGMDVARIAQVFAIFVRCKVNNALKGGPYGYIRRKEKVIVSSNACRIRGNRGLYALEPEKGKEQGS